MKNPMVLAVINFVTIGGGTLLLGKRPVVGLLLTVGAGICLRYEEMRIAPLFTGIVTLHWVVSVTGLSLLGLGTAMDVYREAKGGA